MSRTHTWQFPLPRTHTGILQGNGTMGAMIWGSDNVLKITIGRADFWDHRGGMPWREGMSYSNIRRLLEAGDEVGLRALFEATNQPAGEPRRPTVLPLGRVEIVFEPHLTLDTGELNLDNGEMSINLRAQGRTVGYITLNLAMNEPILNVQSPQSTPPQEVRCVPAWEYVGSYLKSISFHEPELFASDKISGWVQARPADPTLCLGYRLVNGELWLTTAYGANASEARSNAWIVRAGGAREKIGGAVLTVLTSPDEIVILRPEP